MSAIVLLILLNELGESDKMQGLQVAEHFIAFLHFFNFFSDTVLSLRTGIYAG